MHARPPSTKEQQHGQTPLLVRRQGAGVGLGLAAPVRFAACNAGVVVALLLACWLKGEPLR